MDLDKTVVQASRLHCHGKRDASTTGQRTFPELGVCPMTRTVLSTVAWLLLASIAAAAEPKLVFEDLFDGKLGPGWSWLREKPDTWRIRDKALEIRVEPGVAGDVKNALLRAAPDRGTGRFAVEVTVTMTSPPTKQYEQAGITWYEKGNPVFKLVHERIDGKTYIIPGKIPTSGKTVRLRLILQKDQLIAQFRPDPKAEFQTVGTRSVPPAGSEQISLQCYQGPPDEEHWMRFDDFRILQLLEER